jgi:L1 cell adhesion molecule like protein
MGKCFSLLKKNPKKQDKISETSEGNQNNDTANSIRDRHDAENKNEERCEDKKNISDTSGNKETIKENKKSNDYIKSRTRNSLQDLRYRKEKLNNDNYIIGIDLGTTNSLVGVYKNNNVNVISNKMGKRITPSIIYYPNKKDKNKDIIVGEGAKNKKNLENIIYDVKRLIGRNFSDKQVKEDIKHWPFKIESDENDKPMIKVEDNEGEKKYYPEQISALILKELKKRAEEYLGREVKEAVITVPAYFNNNQRQSTIDAAKIAGFNEIRTINEPTAAAIAYGIENEIDKNNEEKKICVFDFGGGTFDVTILKIVGKEFTVINTGGDTHLGGQDIDNLLVKYCIKEFKNETGIDISNNKRAKIRLRDACIIAKHGLIEQAETNIDVDSLENEIDFRMNLNKTLFDDICKDIFKRCIDNLDKTISESKIRKEEINELVLVGGSSRIKKIQEMIEKYFNGKIKISKAINCDEAVVIGASIFAARINESQTHDRINDLIIADIVPISLGLKIEGDKMDVIIQKGTPIPCSFQRQYESTENFQKKVQICIYEGENENVCDNELLDNFYLNITPREKSYLYVTFEIDANYSILKVSAEELAGNNYKEVKITRDKRKLY